MKRKLLPLLIAGLTVASANVALAGAPTVYGKVNLTLNQYDLNKLDSTGNSVQNQDTWKMESNASRLGVKGDVDVAGSLKAIYKLEYEVIPSADKEGDGSSPFKQRNTYVGLQDSWGSVIFGRNDTPVKAIRTEVEAFHDLQIADVSYVLVGENRQNNMVMYTSPTMSGFAVTLMTAPGEGSGKNAGTSASAKHDNNDNSLFDSTSIALTYTNSDLFLALAAEQNVAKVDTIELSGQYKIGAFKFGAVIQQSEENTKGDGIAGSSLKGDGFSDYYGGGTFAAPVNDLKKQDGYLVNAQWTITKEIAVKAQYAHSDNEHTNSALDDTTIAQIAIGADYKLSDAAKLFAYYAEVGTEGQTFNNANPDNTKDSTFAVGYEMKF